MFMKDKKSASLFQKEQVMESLKQSFVKLNPRVMIKNPIMFHCGAGDSGDAGSLHPLFRDIGIRDVRL